MTSGVVYRTGRPILSPIGIAPCLVLIAVDIMGKGIVCLSLGMSTFLVLLPSALCHRLYLQALMVRLGSQPCISVLLLWFTLRSVRPRAS